jgi:4-hydroxybenzoate polyprenyltransferase
MVFSFTFFTYNGQRLVRLRIKILQPENIGDRLKWVIKYQNPLTFFSIAFGIIGLVCTYFINPYCFIALIPMGALSVFYVFPIIPFYSKSPTLREIPYLKIIFIGIVWSIAIVWIPLIDTKFPIGMATPNTFYALFQNFLFVIAITLPFDIRDIQFDKLNKLKTIPQILGSKKTVLLSELLLVGSILLLAISDIKLQHFYALLIGHIITMVIIALTTEKRKELFFAGIIEGTVLILYGCVLIADYLFFL